MLIDDHSEKPWAFRSSSSVLMASSDKIFRSSSIAYGGFQYLPCSIQACKNIPAPGRVRCRMWVNEGLMLLFQGHLHLQGRLHHPQRWRAIGPLLSSKLVDEIGIHTLFHCMPSSILWVNSLRRSFESFDQRPARYPKLDTRALWKGFMKGHIGCSARCGPLKVITRPE